MAKLTLGKKSFDAPDSIADGDVADALKEFASAVSAYAKSGKSEPVRKLLDKIVKTAVPNDLKDAKDDKKAKGVLEEIKKIAADMANAIDKVKKVEK